MKSLTLTIVIPAYNEESHIKDCLDSIANQEEMPEEVIVVDNNSTDRTSEIAASYPFVRVITEQSQGVLSARNAGFNAANSDIIGRIDAETHLPADWAGKVKELFSDEALSAVSGPVGYHDVPFREIGLFFDKNIRKAVWNIGIKDDAVFLFGGNMALRRSAWLDVKEHVCSRDDIHEDLDLAIHLDQLGRHIRYEKTLTAYTSSRRMKDPTKAFYKYVSANKRTYAVHDIQTPADDLTLFIVLWAKFGVNMIQRAYDPETKQLSLKRFVSGSGAYEARKSPVKFD